MALTSTIYNLEVELADVDRGVYETLDLRVARHPSETAEYMLTRVLAYCLQHQEGIRFAEGGISSGDEPAVSVRDLTGRMTAWIEIGMPDAERLHRGSKLAGRVAVYTHRDAGQKIHRASEIPVYAFDRRFIEAAAGLLERRTRLSLSVAGGQLYVEIGGRTFSSAVAEHRIG